MKTSTLARNGVSTETADLFGRLVELIGWPERRSQSDARQWAMWRRYCSMASRAWRRVYLAGIDAPLNWESTNTKLA